MTIPAILWLCRDFRFDDNVALSAACADGPVLPVFILDAATRAQGSASRWRLGRALAAFDAAWAARTGEHITVLEGSVAKFLVSSTTFDMPLFSGSWGEARGVIEFKGVHYPKSVIL
ncbi:deoxyribodipyrimidine photo-lyase, partial [Pseudogemmobacter faecipullorum]